MIIRIKTKNAPVPVKRHEEAGSDEQGKPHEYITKTTFNIGDEGKHHFLKNVNIRELFIKIPINKNTYFQIHQTWVRESDKNIGK